MATDPDKEREHKERAKAFLDRWSKDRLRADLEWLFAPPPGYDSWADFEKYGEAFIKVDFPKSTELATVPKEEPNAE